MKMTVICLPGYTLDTKGSGSNEFVVRCLAGPPGKFSQLKEFKPVACQSLPVIKHGLPALMKYPHYGNSATYTCNEGYTLSGKAKTVGTFQAPCEKTCEFKIEPMKKWASSPWKTNLVHVPWLMPLEDDPALFVQEMAMM